MGEKRPYPFEAEDTREEEERILEAVDWLDIISHLLNAEQLDWKRRSSGVIYLRCVFHQERTPSLVLWPSGNFKCHGCSACGTKLDFIRELGLDDHRDGVNELSASVGKPEIHPGQMTLGEEA